MVGTLSGTVVRTKDLEPARDVEIMLRRTRPTAAGRADRSARTDTFGCFSFAELPSGEWRVLCIVGGRPREVVAHVLDDAVTVVDIEIEGTVNGEFPAGLLHTVWALTHLNGQPFPHRVVVTLIENGRLDGDAPCNSFVAKFRVQWPRLHFQRLHATELACADLEAEMLFFDTLEGVDRADVEDRDRLILSSVGGAELRFRRLEERPKAPLRRSRKTQMPATSRSGPAPDVDPDAEYGMSQSGDRASDADPGGPASSTVRGRVIDARTAQPVADASVTIVRAAGPFPDIAPLTDPDGRFVLEDLTPGEWVFRALGPDGRSGDATLTLHPGQRSEFVVRID